MRILIIKLIAAVGMVVITTAGCSHSEPGAPAAVANGAGSSFPQANDHGAPRVPEPLDVTSFLAKPCAVLTPQQVTELGLSDQGEPDTEGATARDVGPSCVWHNVDDGLAIGISFLVGNKNGLSDTYRGREQGNFPGLWEPATVVDYPAVFNDVDDRRATGSCPLTTAVSDSLTFLAYVQGRKLHEESCDRARQAAASVIATVKAHG